MNYQRYKRCGLIKTGFAQVKDLPWGGLLGFFLAVLATLPVLGGGAVKSGNYVAILSATPGAEMPRRAAELVAQAGAADMAQTTIEVIKSAVGINPAAVLAVVGCVAETVPAMAATAAGTAATLEPYHAVAIVRAAASVAPGEAGPMTAAVCRVIPANYQAVALAVAREAPGSDRAVLAGVAEAMPELKGKIEAQLAGNDGKQPGVGLVLAEVAVSTKAATLLTQVGHGSGGLASAQSQATTPDLSEFTGEGGASGQDGVSQPKNVALP